MADSPDGKRVAVAVTDAAATLLRVFDAVTGKELLSLGDHTGAVRSLAFLADNRTLVSASADKTVRLSDVNLLNVIDAHAGGVAGCAFLPDGVQAVSGGADKTVKLWNLTTGQAVKTFGPLPDAVSAVAVSKDGRGSAPAAGQGSGDQGVDGRRRQWEAADADARGGVRRRPVVQRRQDEDRHGRRRQPGARLGRGDRPGIAVVPARRGGARRGLPPERRRHRGRWGGQDGDGRDAQLRSVGRGRLGGSRGGGDAGWGPRPDRERRPTGKVKLWNATSWGVTNAALRQRRHDKPVAGRDRLEEQRSLRRGRLAPDEHGAYFQLCGR